MMWVKVLRDQIGRRGSRWKKDLPHGLLGSAMRQIEHDISRHRLRRNSLTSRRYLAGDDRAQTPRVAKD
jgi:hypothetical protein